MSQKKFFLAAGVVIGALLLLDVLLWLHRPVHSRTDISPFENDMVENLVRSLLREDGLRDSPVCFLAFGENAASPSTDFIQRFTDCQHPAVQCLGSSVAPPVNRVLDKDTGHPGLVIRIIDFHEVLSSTYDYTVSISNLPTGHDHVVYRVSNVGGSWMVKKRS